MKTWSLVGVLDVLKHVEKITRPPRRPNHDCDEPVAEASQLAAEVCRAHGAETCFVCDEDDDALWVHPRDADGAEQLAEREAAEEVSEPVSRADHLGPYHDTEMFGPSWWLGRLTADDGRLTDDDTPNPTEPSLDDSELVAVRNLLTAADGTSFETLRRIVRWWLAKPLHERNDKLRCFCPICAPHLHDQSSADGSAQGPADGPAGVDSPPQSPPAGRSRYDECGGGPW